MLMESVGKIDTGTFGAIVIEKRFCSSVFDKINEIGKYLVDRIRQMNNIRRKRKKCVLIFVSILVVLLLSSLAVFGLINNEIHSVSFYSVSGESMQDVYPDGSLLVVSSVSEQDIKIGDDLSFETAEGSVVTHRVIRIYENYQESGKRGFQTKGVNSVGADRVVTIDAVKGRVVFSIIGSDFTLYICILCLVFAFLILGFGLKFRSKKEYSVKDLLAEHSASNGK